MVAVVLATYGAAAALALVREPVDAFPFLAGGRAQEHALSRYHVRWYAVTLLFLAFDMEMVFMYPWTLVVTAVGSTAVVEMFLFLGVLLVGVVYAWRRAAVDLTGRLLRWVADRPRLLIVPTPGGTAARLAVERQQRERGWSRAASPADASLLVVCGALGDRLAAAADVVWAEMPAPRARVKVVTTGDLDAVDAARRTLADVSGQRRASAGRRSESAAQPLPTGRDDMRGHETVGHEMGGHEMGGHDMGGHDMRGHEMGGHDMPGGMSLLRRAANGRSCGGPGRASPRSAARAARPGACGLAGRAGHPPRPAGGRRPVADVEVFDGGPAHAEPFWDRPVERGGDQAAARRPAAAALDSLGRLFAVAGWDGASITARRLRDDTLDPHSPAATLAARAERFARRARRSRLLRRMTDGLAVDATTDVTGRWTGWLDDVVRLLAAQKQPGGTGDPTSPASAPPSLDGLPSRLAGLDLATARLVVAGLDPDTDRVTAGTRGHVD